MITTNAQYGKYLNHQTFQLMFIEFDQFRVKPRCLRVPKGRRQGKSLDNPTKI